MRRQQQTLFLFRDIQLFCSITEMKPSPWKQSDGQKSPQRSPELSAYIKHLCCSPQKQFCLMHFQKCLKICWQNEMLAVFRENVIWFSWEYMILGNHENVNTGRSKPLFGDRDGFRNYPCNHNREQKERERDCVCLKQTKYPVMRNPSPRGY